MSVKAIIPFKLHSKGLPNKLIMNFAGKKMYHWVIEAAIDCKRIDEIYLTGNRAEKKLIYDEVKVLYPQVKWVTRPKSLQENGVELLEVMQYVLKKIGNEKDIFIQLQANKPLTKAKDLKDIMDTYYQGHNYICFPMCYPVFEPKTNFYNTLFTVQQIDTAVNWEYKSSRQDGKRNFKSCAIAKVWDYETLKSAKKGTWGKGEKHYDYIIDHHHKEIDTEEDFRIAEALKKAGF